MLFRSAAAMSPAGVQALEFEGLNAAGLAEIRQVCAQSVDLDRLPSMPEMAAQAGAFQVPAPTEVKAAPMTEKRLSELTADFIKRTASREDSPFGSVAGGNLGLSAYALNGKAADRTIKKIAASFPGMALSGKNYSDGWHRLVLVVTSDDEPYVHMYDQDRGTGAMVPVDYFNSADLNEGEDWSSALDAILNGGLSAPIPLGKGSADPYWWSK